MIILEEGIKCETLIPLYFLKLYAILYYFYYKYEYIAETIIDIDFIDLIIYYVYNLKICSKRINNYLYISKSFPLIKFWLRL